VRAEDRELEGPDLERAGETRDVAAHEEEELPAIGGEELRDLELEHRSTLFDAIRLVLAGEEVVVSLLYLPQRETHALEALQAAVNGQDSVGEFVFAEDRRALLEQSLAVLQQNVTHGDPEQLAELHAKFDELTAQVGELRERLVNLEDAQDDLFDEKRQHDEEVVVDEGDKDDKPGASAKPGASGKPGKPASPPKPGKPPKPEDPSLYEPERPAPPPPPSTLAGPERAAPPPPPSTLHGDAAPEPPPPSSTLAGPERAAPPPPPSSLYGDARDEPPPPPSELAADAEAAEAKKPWWRWPFG
jgi:hypothetical protein